MTRSPRLQAGGLRIDVGEAGRHTCHIRRVGALEQFLDTLDHLRQQRLDLDEALPAARAFLGDAEHAALGFVEDLFGIASRRVQCTGGDLVTRRDQPAQHRALAHDLGIAANIGRRRRVLRQRAEVGKPARIVGLVRIAQRLEHRHRVGRLAGVDESADRREDQSVVVAIEVIGADQIGNAVPSGVVEKQSAEHGLLGFDGMRRRAHRRKLGIGDRLVHGARRMPSVRCGRVPARNGEL